MPLIQKPALKSLYDSLVATGAKVDAKVLDQIVAIVGDRSPLGRAGLDDGERTDLQALLADDVFKGMLDGPSTNFLRALMGLPPMPAIEATPVAEPVVDVAVPAAKTKAVSGADASLPSYEAVRQLRAAVKSGKLQKLYDAVIGAGAPKPALKAEAEALFASLPVVKPGMTADQLVKLGLWTRPPAHVAEMQKSPRYLPGRQLLCETTVFAKVPAPKDVKYATERKKVGTYDPTGIKAVTYRATLVGEDPANAANFLVHIDGADKPISVTKANIFKHNQHHELAPRYVESPTHRELPYGGWSSWDMDYGDPLAKAKLCEIALKMDGFVGKLDFTSTQTKSTDAAVVGRARVPPKTLDLQKKCVDVVFRSIDMKYPKDDGTAFKDKSRAVSGVRDVARQAIKGTGMCVQQSTVFGGLLMPFMDALGIDGQYRCGNCFRGIKKATDDVYSADNSSGHGWWQITFRPSMTMTIADRTWNEVNLNLDRAYGFPYGDRYPGSNIPGFIPAPITATDVDVTGNVVVEKKVREFSKVGDGRENHIALRQTDPDH